MSYSYKDGYREGVVFAFIKDRNKMLVEHRLVDNEYETFFTSGSIETKDYGKPNDYRVTALFREVDEEFESKINIVKYKYLDYIKVDEINVIFYIYLITDWVGTIPDFTVEDGKKHADVEWVELEHKKDIFKFESAFLICNKIENHIAN